MPTINQLVKSRRRPKRKFSKSPVLDKCPQKRGVCLIVQHDDAQEAEFGAAKNRPRAA